MIKKKVLIIYREDSGLKLEKLVNKIGDVPRISFGAPEKKDIYSMVSIIAKGRGANILVMDKETNEHLSVSLYQDSEINLYHPEELFKDGFGVDSTNSKYSIAKSIDYVLSKR